MGGEKYLKKKWGGTKIWLLYALKDTHMMTPTWAFWELLSKSQKKTTNCDHSPVGGKRDSRRVVRRGSPFCQECLYESRASGM